MTTPDNRPPLIAHVVYSFGTGGMENGMVNLFNRLPPDRYRHVVISLTDHGDFCRRITAQPVEFHDLGKQPGNDYSWMPRLYRLLHLLKPAIVHSRNLNAMEAQFVAALAGIRGRIQGEHGRDVYDLEGRNRRYNLLRRAARLVVHRYIPVSRDLESWLKDTVGVAPARIRQIYNGVDSDKFHPRQGPRPELGPAGFFTNASCVIGSIGRMAQVKDYPSLTRAFIRLCQTASDPGLRLVIVGDGVAREPCLALLREAGLEDRAWLPGNRDDTAELMRCFDVFALTSLGEGISNTILEAMATGLPVVATAVGGNPELVTQGRTGSLLPPGQPEALATLLAGYAADPERRYREGGAARARIEAEFSLTSMAAAYQAVYDSLL